MQTTGSVILVNQLAKHYQVATREAGLKSAVGSLFYRTYRNVKAVDEIIFDIEPGEMVGFLGPTGSEKLPPLKC